MVDPATSPWRDEFAATYAGLRSHKGAQGRTRDQLYAEAKRKGVKGRSRMTKAQLQKAVDG